MTNPRRATQEDKDRGREIARLRKAKHLTQADLAYALGISTQQYGKYERGSDRMAMSRYLKIVEILDRDTISQGFEEKPVSHYQAPKQKAALRKVIDQLRAELDRLQEIVDRAW